MEYSLNGAAQATGKGKSTIHRAIKSGKISATRQAGGTYSIDASELFRVFPRNGDLERIRTVKAQADPPLETLATEIAVLRAKLEAAEKLDAIRVETIEDQRRRLDRAEARVAGLLTDQRGKPDAAHEPARRPGWLQWLLKRG